MFSAITGRLSDEKFLRWVPRGAIAALFVVIGVSSLVSDFNEDIPVSAFGFVTWVYVYFGVAAVSYGVALMAAIRWPAVALTVSLLLAIGVFVTGAIIAPIEARTAIIETTTTDWVLHVVAHLLPATWIGLGWWNNR